MASRILARALELDDLELLVEIDAHYAAQVGLEPVITRASLNFYVRSGHAFVSLAGETMTELQITGFVLAQSVWNGQRPVVQVGRLALADTADETSRQVLLEAITKSAYDAAVYELRVLHASADTKGKNALATNEYRQLDLEVYGRTLGKRGSSGEGLL